MSLTEEEKEAWRESISGFHRNRKGRLVDTRKSEAIKTGIQNRNMRISDERMADSKKFLADFDKRHEQNKILIENANRIIAENDRLEAEWKQRMKGARHR
jgi:hypothetical protein